MQIGDRLALLFFLVVDRLHARYQRTNLPSSHKHACDVANELASRLRENSSPSAKARASETSHLLAAASLLMLAALLALLHLEIQQLDLLVLELRIEARGCVMEQLVCRSCEEISYVPSTSDGESRSRPLRQTPPHRAHRAWGCSPRRPQPQSELGAPSQFLEHRGGKDRLRPQGGTLE